MEMLSILDARVPGAAQDLIGDLGRQHRAAIGVDEQHRIGRSLRAERENEDSKGHEEAAKKQHAIPKHKVEAGELLPAAAASLNLGGGNWRGCERGRFR